MYWLRLAQRDNFEIEIACLQANKPIPISSPLLSLHPFLDKDQMLRAGGRQEHSKLSYSKRHPIILHGKHPISKLLIWSEHQRLLHGGPTLVLTSLGYRFHLLNCRKTVRSVLRQCVTCRRQAIKPQPQMLGQLPAERITPDSVFDRVGIDYAGPFLVKCGSVRKPTIVKAYLCVFVSLSVKAVHLELVSDLTSEAFIAALRRFIARRGYPSLLWSDHGTNFVGANRELKEFNQFLQKQITQYSISEFCSTKNIIWRFIPEHSPHFGGLWESTVKSVKIYLRKIVGTVKLTFEELITVLTQIEACLNSRPLVSINSHSDDSIEVLTPGHFLIGRPLTCLPDSDTSTSSISLLRRWHLCQYLVRHFWNRWSVEYLSTLNKYSKWHRPVKNVSVDDVVVVHEDGMVPTLWPLARVVRVYPGKDGLVRVADVKTSKGTYRRPVTKLVVLLPSTVQAEL